MLNLVGIESPLIRYAHYPHQLSGGMRQRAMIAMALSCEPKFLIADEPTTALDVTIQSQILDLIHGLQEKLNMAVQFITHDLGVIAEISDRVLVMYAGQTCEVIKTENLFAGARHPYTHALMASRPKFGHRVPRLPTIEGSVPSPSQRAAGCPFFNRCKNALADCERNRPPLLEISTQHFVACFNPVQ
jgi:peptide/nickel transport system ATP-binding protein